MVISATPSNSPRPPPSQPSLKPLPAKLRRQSTLERPPQPLPKPPQPLTPTLLSRSNTRSQSTPPQHVLSSSASFGESIFQSLSFGPFASAPSKLTGPSAHRAPPARSSTMLANVLESPHPFNPHTDPEPPAFYSHTFSPSRRRVTSPDTTLLPGSARAASPNMPPSPNVRLGSPSPRSPPLPVGDMHPRKSRSGLRLSRFRPGSIRDDGIQIGADHVPDTAPATWGDRDRVSACANGGASVRATPVRRPGSAGEIGSKPAVYRSRTKDTEEERAGNAARTRGMRLRASSELTRPVGQISSVLSESDELPPSPEGRPQYAELRPSLFGASSSRLSPVPVSPGVPSIHSKKSAESALADDSDVDADVPTTPFLAQNGGSSLRSQPSVTRDIDLAGTTPTASFSVIGSEVADRTQAREEADRRRREGAVREREQRAQYATYFALKGPGKEKCHTYPPDEVPYPLSYTPKVLNHQTLDLDLSTYMRSSLTWHAFKEHPVKVLDLGCGTGHWIIQAAHEWPKTEFIGFDLVPIQPNLERVTGKSRVSIGASRHSDLRLDERIRWVHGNFLEKLPFDPGEFDYVRCRRIARGVPESKWAGLYEEILRVMKPGAAFEHIEEDIIFPTEIPAKPAQSPVVSYPTPSPSRSLSTPSCLSSSSLPSGARSSGIHPPGQYRRSPSTSFSSAIESPVEGRNGIPSASTTSTSSLVPGSTISSSNLGVNPGATLVVPGSAVSAPISDVTSDSRGSGDSGDPSSKGTNTQDLSFYDPRVHSRLQELFVSMHDARWINLKPLSLIPRLIQEHFVGSIPSAPLNVNLPPRPRDATIEPRTVDLAAVARASGSGLVQQLLRIHAETSSVHYEPAQLLPRPGDDEVAKYLSFDLIRLGTVSKMQGPATMPISQFKFNLGHLSMHLSCAASEILACKEAMWEHLKTKEPEFSRRDYDALIRQYETDIQDRVGLSTTLRQKLGWGPPQSDFKRTPEQRVFEENYAQAIALDQSDPASANRPPGLMRCMRAFVAWKPTE